MDPIEDVTQILPSWQSNPTPFQSDDPQAAPARQGIADDIWLDAELGNIPLAPPVFAAVQQGPEGPAGATGDQGSTGSRGSKGSAGPPGSPGTQGPKGTTGARGSTGPRGTTGARGTRGSTGPRGTKGSQGIPGPRGSTGPKDSIVKTALGNVAFACIEGARPLLSYTVFTSTKFQRIPLRDRFLAAIVPGSAFVYSLVSDTRCPLGSIGAFISEGELYIDADPDARANLTITVAGVNRNFPDWDMPSKTDDERIKAEKFWGGAR